MNPKTLTFIGILVLAFICMVVTIAGTAMTYLIALALVWILSKPAGLVAYMLAFFVATFAATIIKAANKSDE